jgi:triacylglycerol lipase
MTTKLLLAVSGILALQACMVGDVSPPAPEPTQPTDGPPGPPPGPAPTGHRIGIVLAHGLGGSADSFDPAIVAALQGDGYYVLRDSVPGVDSVAVRAAALAPEIDAFIAANQLDRVHIFAHSMGGLDARYLISTLHYASKITSLTTLSTPHRGSPLADLGLGITHSLSVSQQDAVLALVPVLGSDVSSDQLHRALIDLAEANAAAFNAANPDMPGVTYYSIAGYSSVGGVANPNADEACTPDASPSSLPGELTLTGPVVAGDELRPHDGVVPVESSRWTGFLGCIPTDHLDITRAGAKTADNLDVDLVTMYRKLAARVAPL